MSLTSACIYSKRYEDALAPGVIKARAENKGNPVGDLSMCGVEEACARLERGLKEVLLVSVQLEGVIRSEIERAHAHSKLVYSHPRMALQAAYSGVPVEDGVVPSLITGLAGVGKTQFRRAIQRVLAGNGTVRWDAAHPSVPIVDYMDCVVGTKSSVSAVLRSFTSPEVANGNVRLTQEQLGTEATRWLRVSGVCLFGGDEMQFLAQSRDATTLVTKALLALAGLQVPWFVIANYSLAWKLRSRPSEATQRLLRRPVVLLPDPPASSDWEALLSTYQVVLDHAFSFSLVQHRSELWNLCAGLKRLLVELLTLSYRHARATGSMTVSWSHVMQAFSSKAYSAARTDVNLLVAHAGQGGKLRQDLLCPFDGEDTKERAETFQDQLRTARQAAVAKRTIESAMNRQERDALSLISKVEDVPQPTTAKVIKMPKVRKRRTLDEMMNAGADFMASMDREPDK